MKILTNKEFLVLFESRTKAIGVRNKLRKKKLEKRKLQAFRRKEKGTTE